MKRQEAAGEVPTDDFRSRLSLIDAMAERDWYEWHAAYDQPGSGLARRLSWVQDRIRAALDGAPAGPLRVISLCAGQGRDLIGVLHTIPGAAT